MFIPRVIYRFSAIFIKIPMAFFCKNRKKNYKCLWNIKGPPNSPNNLLMRTKWALTLPDFKTYCKATVNKMMWYWHKDSYYRLINGRVESLETKSCVYIQMTFNKSTETTQWRKDTIQQIALGKLICKIMKLDTYLARSAKINSK